MSFTQSVFIRKNTLELRSNLKRIGIAISMDKGDDTGGILVQYGVATNVWSKVAFKDLASNGVIDCGKNENLFLALAALRDDSDYMQWFWYKEILFKCIGTGSTVTMDGLYSLKFKAWTKGYIELMNNCVRKATLEELIECFKGVK